LRSLIIDAWMAYYVELKAALGIVHFTMDNASNNASTMLHLSLMLQDFNVTFDEKNYICCFAHIVNLCSQAVIKVMEKDNGDMCYNKMGDTDAYIIAMFINPSIRFEWIRKNCPIPPRKTMDMIGYWMVCFRNPEMLRRSLTSTQHHGKTTWPKIFRLFANYAPIQATSVPSEQVFSSSAETDTKRRNRISPPLMEGLQMLKFNFKKARLNFMADWQLALVPNDEEDWLRILAGTAEEQRETIRREISDSCEFVDGHVEMPDGNDA
ncbi:hypothetical protein B0H10DRAFT_1788240, partial [Mycena sp. CBHHK59/15]